MRCASLTPPDDPRTVQPGNPARSRRAVIMTGGVTEMIEGYAERITTAAV